MIKRATAMMVRQNLGELLNEVQYRHDSVLITKADKPVAALVNIDLFEKIVKMKNQFNMLTEQLAQSCQNISQDLIEQEIDEAIKSIRDKE